MSRRITIQHNGEEYGGQIGKIKSTALGIEGHGIFTALVSIEWAGAGVLVGGYGLDTRGEDYSRIGTAFGMDHIMKIMSTVGVETWETLVGKQLIVLFKGKDGLGEQALGIASTIEEDEVLIFSEHAQGWKDDEDESA